MQILKILVGNGDPSHSLINRVDDVESLVGGCKKILDNLQRLLVGDLSSGSKETSLVERVKYNEEVVRTIKRVSWIVLSIVIGELVMTVLRLVSTGGL